MHTLPPEKKGAKKPLDLTGAVCRYTQGVLKLRKPLCQNTDGLGD
ncbi:hypothetical protein ACQZV8_20905 [Magnetococcales bacterium HHB-1]